MSRCVRAIHAHVTGPAAEATPVGEDHEGEVLPTVEVVDCLGGLVGRVREPHLFSVSVHSRKVKAENKEKKYKNTR